MFRSLRFESVPCTQKSYRKEEVVTTTTNTVITYSDIAPIIEALQAQISVSTVITILAAAAGVCVGLVFMWWGGRKVVHMLMSAFKNGRLSI